MMMHIVTGWSIVTAPQEFNTRRRYTKDGQRIRWAIFARANDERFVVFRDEARMIQGMIPVFFSNMDLITPEWITRAYDDFHYIHWHRDLQMLCTAIGPS